MNTLNDNIQKNNIIQNKGDNKAHNSLSRKNTHELVKMIINAKIAAGEGRNMILPDRISPLENFGSLLMRVRCSKDLSISAISTITGLDVDILNAIELGFLPFDKVVDLTPLIAKALDIDIDKLMVLLFKPLIEENIS